MEKIVEIISKVIYEDNKLTVKLNVVRDAGVTIEGLDNDLYDIVMDALNIPSCDRGGGDTEEYMDFIFEPRTYAECVAFFERWLKITKDNEAAATETIRKFIEEDEQPEQTV